MTTLRHFIILNSTPTDDQKRVDRIVGVNTGRGWALNYVYGSGSIRRLKLAAALKCELTSVLKTTSGLETGA
jgi:hypothetical protein